MGAAERTDVVVLGSGILGSALAFHLVRRGVWGVRCYDRSPSGPGATGRSAGILSYQGWDAWDLGVVRDSAEELRNLTDRRGVGDYREIGGLRVARTPEGERWLERVRAVLAHDGVEGRILRAEEIAPRIPTADLGDVRAGLFTPGDATFDARAVADQYLREALREGLDLHAGQSPSGIRRTGGAWRLEVPEGPVETARLVLACGAWTKPMLTALGLALPLAPFRTQALLARPRPLSAPFPTLHDLDLDLYVRPAPEGRVVAGDGTEPTEADPDRARLEADADFLDRTVSRLRDLFPGWGAVRPERGWAGVCVASPDRYPLVGRVPGVDGLFVATGFNGFGAMRAPALARRLADALLDDRWSPLAPADPRRFPPGGATFDPRPEFPLDGPPSEGPLPSEPGTPPAAPPGITWAGPGITYRSLETAADIDRLRLPSLSEWFDPFLERFLHDALRTGGRAEVAESDNEIVGVHLFSPTEGLASVFTRRREVAEHYLAQRGRGGLYGEREWVPGAEPIEILAADLGDWELDGPLRNAVRIGTADDLPKVRALMQEMAGSVDDAWFGTLPRADEICFLGEIGGRIAGISWSSVEGRYARGHSFLVHPRYRGLGIGTDLLKARMLWLRDAGIRQVVSEIYEGNRASETAAERAGMAHVGRMFHFPGPAADAPPSSRPVALRSSAPRTSGRPSPSNR